MSRSTRCGGSRPRSYSQPSARSSTCSGTSALSKHMQKITGLRSPHAKVGRIVCFGRMLDKARLNARGVLPPDYQANLGEQKPNQFDSRLCRFLGVPYADILARTQKGGCDEEILSWVHARGTARSDEDCLIW